MLARDLVRARICLAEIAAFMGSIKTGRGQFDRRWPLVPSALRPTTIAGWPRGATDAWQPSLTFGLAHC